MLTEQQTKPKWSDLIELKQNMTTAEEAIDFLVARQYLDETTEITPDTLSYILLLLSASPAPKAAQEGTRAVGLILRKLANNNLARTVSNTIEHMLTPITTDLIEIKKELQEAVRELRNPGTQVKGRTDSSSQKTYAEVVTAYKGKNQNYNIKNRQVLVEQEEGKIADALLKMTDLEIVAKANEAISMILTNTEDLDIKAISSQKLQRGGILIEMNTEEAANIIRRKKEKFCSFFSPTAKVKERTYTVKLKFVPVTHNNESEWEKRRIEENSGLGKEELINTNWVKAIEKRRKGQQVGILITHFRTPQAANKAIKDGIIIQGKRVKGDKPFYGAPRCFICQGYGHYAAACNKKEAGIICATCTGPHHQEQCPISEIKNYKCANCREGGHAAWDPYCPTYKAELEKAVQKNTEIQLRYYPTTEEWTWEKDPTYEIDAKLHTEKQDSSNQKWKESKEDGEIDELGESIASIDDILEIQQTRNRTTSQSTLDHFLKRKGKQLSQDEDDTLYE